MSKAYAWRDAIQNAKALEQRFPLSNGAFFEVAPAGVFLLTPAPGSHLVPSFDRVHLEVDDAELVRLGTWLYETFYEDPTEGQEP